MTIRTRGTRRPDRDLTDREQANLSVIAASASDVALLFPTETGLTKSIFDATESIRTLLRRSGVHDFELQRQGQDAKIVEQIDVLLPDRIDRSEVSLYRPLTKSGDPRLWIRGTPKWANAGEVLALFFAESRLFVANLSCLVLDRLPHPRTVSQGKGAGLILKDAPDSVYSPRSEAAIELLEGLRAGRNAVAEELLSRLRAIAARGWVPAHGKGDSAVGMTLEHLLGIQANSARLPDYKGIELKAKRRSRTETRQTLFAQVPDWSISGCKGSAELLDSFGYMRGEIKKLYCTIRLGIPNSQGLFLSLQKAQRRLSESHLSKADVAVWRIETLEARLLEKHRETFWVSAATVKEGGVEYFSFKSVQHTREPSVALFNDLLEGGHVTVDHLIKRTGPRVSERGPLFKVTRAGVPRLFPAAPAIHELL